MKVSGNNTRTLQGRDQQLVDAIRAKDIGAVEAALDNHASPEAMGTAGFRAMHIAAMAGDARMIKLLIARKAALNPASDDGMTPLMFAVSHKNLECVAALLDAGVSPERPESYKSSTPLQLALNAVGDDDIAICLLRHGADMTACGSSHMPVYYAATWNRHRAVEEMLELGGDIDQRDAKGLTPLMYAVRQGNMAALTFLIEKGADTNAVNDRETPLTLALKLQKNSTQMVVELLRGGADPSRPENDRLRQIGDVELRDLFNSASRLREEYLDQKASVFHEGNTADMTVRKPLRLLKQAI